MRQLKLVEWNIRNQKSCKHSETNSLKFTRLCDLAVKTSRVLVLILKKEIILLLKVKLSIM